MTVQQTLQKQRMLIHGTAGEVREVGTASLRSLSSATTVLKELVGKARGLRSKNVKEIGSETRSVLNERNRIAAMMSFLVLALLALRQEKILCHSMQRIQEFSRQVTVLRSDAIDAAAEGMEAPLRPVRRRIRAPTILEVVLGRQTAV